MLIVVYGSISLVDCIAEFLLAIRRICSAVQIQKKLLLKGISNSFHHFIVV